MAADTDEPRLEPWGSLPAEQYLLQHWGSDVQSKQEQYQRLIREFCEAASIIVEPEPDDVNTTHYTKPTEHQINDILKPWRSEKLRKIACALKSKRSDEVVVLRTHYSDDPAEDETMRQILADNEEEDPNFDEPHVWWQFLDDRATFNFGEEWERVYDILPELTSRGVGKRSSLTTQRFGEAVASEREIAAHGYDYDANGRVQDWARLSAHPIALVDKETFATGRLKLLFIDANGNVVRSARIEVADMAIYRMTSFRGAVGDWSTWQEAEVGERYRLDGDIGRMLHQKLEEARVAEAAERLNVHT